MNAFNKLKEWIRLKKEISNLRLAIWSKEKKVKNNLLKYKHLGLPTLKLNLEYKEKLLKGLFKKEIKKIRKVRSDKGGKHNMLAKK